MALEATKMVSKGDKDGMKADKNGIKGDKDGERFDKDGVKGVEAKRLSRVNQVFIRRRF